MIDRNSNIKPFLYRCKILQFLYTFAKQNQTKMKVEDFIKLTQAKENVQMEEMAEFLNVNERTIHRDVEEMRHIIKHVGPTKGGHWVILPKHKS